MAFKALQVLARASKTFQGLPNIASKARCPSVGGAGAAVEVDMWATPRVPCVDDADAAFGPNCAGALSQGLRTAPMEVLGT